MRLPSTLRVRTHDYRLIIAPDNPLRSEDTQGLCDSTRNEIAVPKEAPPSRQIEIVFHEVLHAALAGHTIEQEELAVVVLGEFLPVFIRDNPDFIRSVLRQLK